MWKKMVFWDWIFCSFWPGFTVCAKNTHTEFINWNVFGTQNLVHKIKYPIIFVFFSFFWLVGRSVEAINKTLFCQIFIYLHTSGYHKNEYNKYVQTLRFFNDFFCTFLFCQISWSMIEYFINELSCLHIRYRLKTNYL